MAARARRTCGTLAPHALSVLLPRSEPADQVDATGGVGGAVEVVVRHLARPGGASTARAGCCDRAAWVAPSSSSASAAARSARGGRPPPEAMAALPVRTLLRAVPGSRRRAVRPRRGGGLTRAWQGDVHLDTGLAGSLAHPRSERPPGDRPPGHMRCWCRPRSGHIVDVSSRGGTRCPHLARGPDQIGGAVVTAATVALALGSGAVGSGAAAPAAPGTNDHSGPVINANFADPDILQVGNVYHAYATNSGGAEHPARDLDRPGALDQAARRRADAGCLGRDDLHVHPRRRHRPLRVGARGEQVRQHLRALLRRP